MVRSFVFRVVICSLICCSHVFVFVFVSPVFLCLSLFICFSFVSFSVVVVFRVCAYFVYCVRVVLCFVSLAVRCFA